MALNRSGGSPRRCTVPKGARVTLAALWFATVSVMVNMNWSSTWMVRVKSIPPGAA